MPQNYSHSYELQIIAFKHFAFFENLLLIDLGFCINTNRQQDPDTNSRRIGLAIVPEMSARIYTQPHLNH